MHKLLIVEDDASVRTTMVTVLELEGYTVDAVSSTREAIERLRDASYPIVISDIYLDERTGIDVLRSARAQNPECVVILMTGRGSMETVMAGMEGGAFEYLAKPFEMAQMLDTIRRAEKSLVGEEDDHEAESIDDLPDTEMIGSSSRMIDIYKTVSKVAPTDATVLIEGETGTGKELIARMIHRNSKRAAQSFVPVDCGAIAPSLLESELFGTLKGAYTGADRDRMGVFESAANGTVFLDEIGDIDLGFQLKLLRFMQEREIRPLGSSRAKKIDVRVIAATNKDFEKEISEGRFREDLYYRLSVIPIHLPPLRERREDIALLARSFLDRYRKSMSKAVEAIEPKAMERLETYDWPGNVRELENTIERAVALETGRLITMEGLPERITRYYQEHRPDLQTSNHDHLVPEGGMDLEQKIGEIERAYLLAALECTGGVRVRASELLKMSYRSFRHYAKKHGV
jgi:DNA-binding NtrC family response regulator